MTIGKDLVPSNVNDIEPVEYVGHSDVSHSIGRRADGVDATAASTKATAVVADVQDVVTLC